MFNSTHNHNNNSYNNTNHGNPKKDKTKINDDSKGCNGDAQTKHRNVHQYRVNHNENNIRIIGKPISVDHAIYSVAFSPSDDKFVLAGDHGYIQIFDILKVKRHESKINMD